MDCPRRRVKNARVRFRRPFVATSPNHLQRVPTDAFSRAEVARSHRCVASESPSRRGRPRERGYSLTAVGPHSEGCRPSHTGPRANRVDVRLTPRRARRDDPQRDRCAPSRWKSEHGRSCARTADQRSQTASAVRRDCLARRSRAPRRSTSGGVRSQMALRNQSAQGPRVADEAPRGPQVSKTQAPRNGRALGCRVVVRDAAESRVDATCGGKRKNGSRQMGHCAARCPDMYSGRLNCRIRLTAVVGSRARAGRRPGAHSSGSSRSPTGLGTRNNCQIT